MEAAFATFFIAFLSNTHVILEYAFGKNRDCLLIRCKESNELNGKVNILKSYFDNNKKLFFARKMPDGEIWIGLW